MPSIYQNKDPGFILEQAMIRESSTEIKSKVGVGAETESEVQWMVGHEVKQRRLD